MYAPSLLITFAVKEESHPFQKRMDFPPRMRVLLTGIGQRNAARTFPKALAEQSPDLVMTCGFAGGLNPELTLDSVVFSADENFTLAPALRASGARAAKFFCSERVAVTVQEKQELRRRTGADAVEMESGVIRGICRERKIPS